MAKLLLALIAVYQATLSRLINATLGPVCRFTPSCSRYAAACIADHGALRGSLLSLRRLCKCHPFHPGGHDPPPPRKIEPNEANAPNEPEATSGERARHPGSGGDTPHPEPQTPRRSGMAHTGEPTDERSTRAPVNPA